MKMHFIILSLMFSLKDIKLPVQTFLVKIDIKSIISHSSYYLPPLFLHGLIWYGNGFIPSSCTIYIDLGILDPVFPWQWKYPFKCKPYCKVFRISGWKITQFSISCLLCCEWQKMSGYHGHGHHQLLSPKCFNRIWELSRPKLSLKNSQLCTVNKILELQLGRVIDLLLGENFHPVKCPPGLILWVWIRGLERQILPCKWIIYHWPSSSFTALSGPHMGLADMQCKVLVTLSIFS